MSLNADVDGPLAPKPQEACLLNILGTDKPNFWGSGVCSDPSPVFFTDKGVRVLLLTLGDALAKVLVMPAPALVFSFTDFGF